MGIYMKYSCFYKKKLGVSFAVVLIGTSLVTGCGNSIPDMSEEEQQAVGEYAAMTLLKYDANHRSRLVDIVENVEPEIEEETPSVETTPTPETSIPSTIEEIPVEAVQNTPGSIAEFLKLPEGISIIYQGMEVCDSYPDDGAANNFFSLDASEGKKLLVLNFQLTNAGTVPQDINILGQSAVFKVSVNDSYTRTSLITMLEGDLSTYIGRVEAGSTNSLVLLIEIDKNMADSINTLSLTIKDTEDTYTTTLM
jgi:hypothetical protein